MPAAVDLTGRKFGRLDVVRFIGSRHDDAGYRRRFYAVRCECGVERELDGLRLTSGNTKSCGCLKAEVQQTGSLRHGHARSRRWSPEYRTWQSMLRRCLTPSASAFVKYGAKGVTVCDAWQASFESFLADMGPKPSPRHSIDRINPEGNYEPGNCRWATASEQNKNRRPFRRTRK